MENVKRLYAVAIIKCLELQLKVDVAHFCISNTFESINVMSLSLCQRAGRQRRLDGCRPSQASAVCKEKRQNVRSGSATCDAVQMLQTSESLRLQKHIHGRTFKSCFKNNDTLALVLAFRTTKWQKQRGGMLCLLSHDSC